MPETALQRLTSAIMVAGWGVVAVASEPLADVERCALLGRMHDANAASAAAIWEAAVAFYRTGTPVPLIAHALGMSERSFYRKLGGARGPRPSG